jgi:hypothetical protein
MEFFRESDRVAKKYMTKINNKTYHFGSEGSETYLDHKDKAKRYAYIARHRPNEDWDSINPASLSRYILWGTHTNLNKAIESYLKRFKLKDIRKS